MTVINIIGNPTDKALEELILTRLSQSYRVTYIKNKSLVQTGSGYDIVIADAAELKSLYIPECIVVMKNDGPVPDIPLPEKSIIIVNAENTRQLIELQKTHHDVIVCGAGERDTVSCSSYGPDGDSVVISLNREITAFSGRKIEPLEIPLQLDKIPKDMYYPMAFTALRLILDDFNSDLGKLI